MHIAKLGLWEDSTNGITIQPDQSKVKIDKAGEFSVWFNGNGRVDVAIDEKYHGKVCGLLGNANDDPDDDFQKLTANGLELVSDVTEFANSWVVPGSCP
uniref:von Willebrand factor-like n=1 Tax=Saccoglossus kowalevskii TaxID=10224 RepID=A0ABM0LYA9_SACKO|nr:PREDICTED: von Willebrand factor-like [Saccoglossus kowalevskii]